MPRPRNQVPIPVFRAESEFEVKNAEFRAPEVKNRDLLINKNTFYLLFFIFYLPIIIPLKGL